MKDEDVEIFYGHTKCQGFAKNHVCIITPEYQGPCGCTYEKYKETPAGEDPNLFEVPKGECLDPVKGEYTGANEFVKEKSHGVHERYYLYSMFGFPHTSCGCFADVVFYIKDVDGFGIVSMDLEGTFMGWSNVDELKDETRGGEQKEGLMGTSIDYIKSPSFLKGDGGWRRVVWMSSDLKEQAMDVIPDELKDKIATEKDARNVEQLKKFLEDVGHPVTNK